MNDGDEGLDGVAELWREVVGLAKRVANADLDNDGKNGIGSGNNIRKRCR